MSEDALLHVQVAGRDLLLQAGELREVVNLAPVTAVPGAPPGIWGVMVHHGEFLPILSWTALPGAFPAVEPAAVAVLWPRLGLPIDRLIGPVARPAEGWGEPLGEDPWSSILGGSLVVEHRAIPVLDSGRLLAFLRGSRHEP